MTRPQTATQAQIALHTQAVTQSFAGPLPHPEILIGYEQVLPGAAARIIALAETQAHHRMDLERTVIESDQKRSWAGLIAGVAVALAFLSAATWLIMTGHEVAGTFLGTIDIVALVGTFVYGSQLRKSERIERARMLAGK